MNLPVVSTSEELAWYRQGLKFTCTCCGNCCTGGAGYVWVSDEEVKMLAEHLKISVEEALEQYCRTINGRVSLKELRSVGGKYDCVFLKEIKPPRASRNGQVIVQAKRVCGIYEVRPLQCRTWPFWPENLTDRAAWQVETRKCPGMNMGKHYSLPEIEKLRDATEWPQKSPGSK